MNLSILTLYSCMGSSDFSPPLILYMKILLLRSLINLRMALYTRDSGINRAKDMAKEFVFLLMGIYMKDIGPMACPTNLADLFTLT